MFYWLLLTTLCSSIYESSSEEFSPCFTPNGENGHCVRVESCLFKFNIYSTPDHINLILQCKEGNLTLVCCPYGDSHEVLPPGSYKGFVDQQLISCGDTAVNQMEYVDNTQLDTYGFKAAGDGAWPWLASIGQAIMSYRKVNIREFTCDGALINSQWVLTAAQCIYRGRPNIVQLGGNSRYNCKKCSLHRIRYRIIHEDFKRSGSGFVNNIGLIQLFDPVTLTERVRPICLPTKGMGDSFHYHVTFYAGYKLGRSFRNQSGLSDVLCDTLLTVNECNDLLSEVRDGSTLCTTAFVKDICQRTAGGPIMLVNGNSYYVIGVKSEGEACHSTQRDTLVTSYLHWIDFNMAFNKETYLSFENNLYF